MPQKLYVGNLPYRTTEDDLRKLFKKYEPIHSLILIADKNMDQPRGYGFIELDEPRAGDALYDLSDTEFNGRSLKLHVAGMDPKNKAEEENAPGEKTFEKAAAEKRRENKHTAATPRRNKQTTVTEYMVADTDNYG